MPSWTFTDNTNWVTITRDAQTFRVRKSFIVTMTVTEPVLFFYYSFNNAEVPALRLDGNQNRKALNRRLFEIDFNDVTSPVVASATALQTVLDGYFGL